MSLGSACTINPVIYMFGELWLALHARAGFFDAQ